MIPTTTIIKMIQEAPNVVGTAQTLMNATNYIPESAKLNSKNSNATRTVIPKQKRYQNACKKSIIRVKRV